MVQASMFARILKWAGLGFLSFFILLCVSLLIALWPGIPARVPLVKFHYQAAIDRYLCSSEGKSRILPSWHTELETKFSLLKDEWSNVGPKLLAETSKLIGTPFSHSEYDIPIFHNFQNVFIYFFLRFIKMVQDFFVRLFFRFSQNIDEHRFGRSCEH